MKAQEKWERLTHPKTVDDYSLSMTEAELLEFDEGRKLVESLRRSTDKRMNLVELMLMGNERNTIERVSYGVLTAYPLEHN